MIHPSFVFDGRNVVLVHPDVLFTLEQQEEQFHVSTGQQQEDVVVVIAFDGHSLEHQARIKPDQQIEA
jgi:hypothetical protein